MSYVFKNVLTTLFEDDIIMRLFIIWLVIGTILKLVWFCYDISSVPVYLLIFTGTCSATSYLYYNLVSLHK